MTPRSSLSHLANGSYELSIYGFFPHPHWMVFLFSGLADSKVSVLSGKAIQDSTRRWDATFRLDFKHSDATPEYMDYVALAQTKSLLSGTGMPKLTAFRLARKRDEGIEVHLEGPDQVGFLGKLLSQASLLALFPVEMEVNTVSSHIQDRIVFRGFGGLAPDAHADVALKNLLNNLVEAR